MSERYALLCDISLTLSSIENVEVALQKAMAMLTEMVSFQRATLVTLNQCETAFRVRTLVEKREDCSLVDLPDVSVNVGLAGRCIQRARVTYVPDVQPAQMMTPAFADPGMANGELHSVLCLPLFVFSKCTGALVLAAAEVNAFDPGDIQLIRQVAGHVAIAVDRTSAIKTVHGPSLN